MCLILYTKINNDKILAKNRDLNYKTNTEIVHEIVNGIEIVYLKDLFTNYIEGMNENGFAILNSSLNTQNKTIFFKKDNFYKYLHDKLIKQKLDNCLLNNICPFSIEGHTLFFLDNECFHIEKYNTSNKNIHINKLKNNRPSVFTNHGIYEKEGHISNISGFNSFIRKHIIETEIKNSKIHTKNDLLKAMNTYYKNIHPKFHPYRYSDVVNTSSQIIINMTNKEFNYYTDFYNEHSVKYVNKLPNNYKPKIIVNIEITKKNMFYRKNIFSTSYLNKILKMFNIPPILKEKKNQKKIQNRNTYKNAKKHLQKKQTKKINKKII